MIVHDQQLFGSSSESTQHASGVWFKALFHGSPHRPTGNRAVLWLPCCPINTYLRPYRCRSRPQASRHYAPMEGYLTDSQARSFCHSTSTCISKNADSVWLVNISRVKPLSNTVPRRTSRV